MFVKDLTKNNQYMQLYFQLAFYVFVDFTVFHLNLAFALFL